MNPRPLLHLEGAAVLAVSVFAYHSDHGSWGLFALLFLMPDVSMVGYLANAQIGAAVYNAVHTYLGPLLCVLDRPGQLARGTLQLLRELLHGDVLAGHCPASRERNPGGALPFQQ